ncbi:hypothetical protein [Dictyobacter formicarum]|nr:hypothetical protein [Dictyobacter formicarum]
MIECNLCQLLLPIDAIHWLQHAAVLQLMAANVQPAHKRFGFLSQAERE